MPEKAEALRNRTRVFAVRVLRFARTVRRDVTTDCVTRQLVRSGTGKSSNYHAACRSRSRAEFVSRMAVALEEVDETWNWLSILQESGLTSGQELDWLLQESAELRAIFSRSVTTARRNLAEERGASEEEDSKPGGMPNAANQNRNRNPQSFNPQSQIHS